MKKIVLLFFLAIAALSQAQVKIEVTNRYPFDRSGELVEIGAAEVGALNASMVIKDSTNQEVPYQL
ncbi:MAG: hypothetical protein RBT57_09495, partial [Paludibacter sp.]|nr:hypothetical protein [Paludibacter sp.]